MLNYTSSFTSMHFWARVLSQLLPPWQNILFMYGRSRQQSSTASDQEHINAHGKRKKRPPLCWHHVRAPVVPEDMLLTGCRVWQAKVTVTVNMTWSTVSSRRRSLSRDGRRSSVRDRCADTVCEHLLCLRTCETECLKSRSLLSATDPW